MRRSTIAMLLGTVLVSGCVAEPGPEDDFGPDSKEDAAAATDEGKADWGFDICENRGWYGDGECDWFCPQRDQDCNAAPLGPEPSGTPTRYPILLAHGFDASPSNYWGFFGVAEALRADGHQVHIAMVPPYDSPEVRAAALEIHLDATLAEFGATKVNIIAHSMGGLDSRHLASPGGLDRGDSIAAISMMATAHRGTRIADIALGLLPDFADPAINALASMWGRTYSEVAGDSHLQAAMRGISEQNAPLFNAANPDHPGVYYQSWAGVSSVLGLANAKNETACEGKLLLHEGTVDKVDWRLKVQGSIVGGLSRIPNDGLITVESSKWANFRGCLPVDHLDEVGQVRDLKPDQNTGFDHLRFYRNLAFELTTMGY